MYALRIVTNRIALNNQPKLNMHNNYSNIGNVLLRGDLQFITTSMSILTHEYLSHQLHRQNNRQEVEHASTNTITLRIVYVSVANLLARSELKYHVMLVVVMMLLLLLQQLLLHCDIICIPIIIVEVVRLGLVLKVWYIHTNVL